MKRNHCKAHTIRTWVFVTYREMLIICGSICNMHVYVHVREGIIKLTEKVNHGAGHGSEMLCTYNFMRSRHIE